MSLTVGLDVGTQSVKLVAYDAAARAVVATHGQPLELMVGDDGSREQRAEWWLDAIRACFAALAPALRARVTAIGVSGQQHGFVPHSMQIAAGIDIYTNHHIVIEELSS
jgi:xylulokinase